MTDMICRKTMMRCQTPGMCSPFGGCRDDSVSWYARMQEERAADKARIAELEQQHHRDSAELRRLCADRDSFQRVGIQSTAERNELLGLLREAREIIEVISPFDSEATRRIDAALSKHSPQGKGGDR